MAIQKQKLAADILEYVGGVDNVCDVAQSSANEAAREAGGGYESRHSRGTISNSIRWYS